VALLWNERQLDSTPFLSDYEALLLNFATDYAAVRHENIDGPALTSFFDVPYDSWIFENPQSFDFDRLKGRILSSSYAPAPGHPQHEPMLAELLRIFDLHQIHGRVSILYDTRLHIGR
jgi:hypothetical protein